MSRLYLFGLGSPHGWDMLGWLIAHRLREQLVGHDDIHVDTLGQPADLFVHALQPDDRLLLVDAMLGKDEPGSLYVFTPAELPKQNGQLRHRASSHGIDLRSVLELLVATGFPPERIRIYGVAVPAQTEMVPAGSRLSGLGLADQVAGQLRPRILAWQPNQPGIGIDITD